MVDHGLVSPDWKPLVTLLDSIHGRLETDLRDWAPVCLTVAVGHASAPGGTVLVRLASTGEGDCLFDAQTEHGGPVPDAVAIGRPVSTPNVWHDDRWPALTRQRLTDRFPGLAATWEDIVGMAVVPGSWDEGGLLVLSCCLATAADQDVVDVLKRYEPMVAAGLAVVHASTAGASQQVFQMLRSRAVIEQAKGAIMGATRCDAHTAWTTLRNASQYFNVKLRDLAIALMEHLGHAPAEQPTAFPPATPTNTARRAAHVTWAAITHRRTVR